MMYTIIDTINDLMELKALKKMYKEGEHDVNLEIRFDDQFAWKRCELADQMELMNWIVNSDPCHANYTKRFWIELPISMQLLAHVIKQYYRTYKETNRGEIISIGNIRCYPDNIRNVPVEYAFE